MATDPNRFPNLIFTRVVARPRHSTVRVSRGRNAPYAVRMSKRRSVKSLVKAAIAGVRASGIEVERVEVSQEGRVVVFAGKPGAVTAFDANPWDQVLDHAQDQERLT